MKDFFIALVRVGMPVLQILLSLMPGLGLAQLETISAHYIFEARLYTYNLIFLKCFLNFFFA